MNRIFASMIFFVSLSIGKGCDRNSVSLGPVDYVGWVEDPENGLSVQKKLDKYTFELQYKPLEYVVLKDNSGKSFTENEMEKGADEIGDMQYFTFRISDEKGGDLLRDDISSVDQFSSRLAYFSNGMQKDVKLIEAGDTLCCLLFHFERTYGVDPRSTFVMGFPLAKGDGKGGVPSMSDKVFLFDDHQLGAGPVYMTVGADNINHIAKLKLN